MCKKTNLAGRIIFGLAMVVFGVNHFMVGEGMAGMVPSYLPGGVLWVYLTGVMLVAGGVGVMVNKVASYSGFLLAFTLLCFVLMIHVPAALALEPFSLGGIGMLLKDLGLMAGALVIAGYEYEA